MLKLFYDIHLIDHIHVLFFSNIFTKFVLLLLVKVFNVQYIINVTVFVFYIIILLFSMKKKIGKVLIKSKKIVYQLHEFPTQQTEHTSVYISNEAYLRRKLLNTNPKYGYLI